MEAEPIAASHTDNGKPMLTIRTPDGSKEVLLHTCCAPCSSAIVECLLFNGIRPTLFFYNPNIYPFEEYLKRKKEAVRFARLKNLDFIDADYDHAQWRDGVKGLEALPERGNRCLRCFTLRLMETARYACEHGPRLFATTLASSRWKRLDQVNEGGRVAAACYPGTLFWEQNWRKGGLQELRGRLLKEYGFYNQRYCGCEFSYRPEPVLLVTTNPGNSVGFDRSVDSIKPTDKPM